MGDARHSLAAAWIATAATLSACGARTGLRLPDASPDAAEPPPRPRPVAPLSTSYVSTRRPTLEWRLGADATSVRVELSRDLSFTTPIAFDVEGSTARPPRDLAPGVWFWRVRPAGETGPVSEADAPIWELAVPRRSAEVDAVLGVFVDVNRDGFADAMIGSWSMRLRPPAVSVGDVRLGGRDGPGPPVYRHVEPRPADGPVRLHYLGDVNGDGYGDALVVRAPGLPTTVLLGTATGVTEAPRGGFNTAGAHLLAAGDLDHDGYGDAVSWGDYDLGCDLLRGGPASLRCAPSWPALAESRRVPHASVVSAGDLDGDGFADVAFFPMRNQSPSDVTIFRGGADGISATRVWTLRSAESGGSNPEAFGFSVASPGDIDGDGYDDLLVGQPDTGGTEQGAVYVYRGGPDGPSRAPAWTLRAEGILGYGGAVTAPDQQSWF